MKTYIFLRVFVVNSSKILIFFLKEMIDYCMAQISSKYRFLIILLYFKADHFALKF